MSRPSGGTAACSPPGRKSTTWAAALGAPLSISSPDCQGAGACLLGPGTAWCCRLRGAGPAALGSRRAEPHLHAPAAAVRREEEAGAAEADTQAGKRHLVLVKEKTTRNSECTEVPVSVGDRPVPTGILPLQPNPPPWEHGLRRAWDLEGGYSVRTRPSRGSSWEGGLDADTGRWWGAGRPRGQTASPQPEQARPAPGPPPPGPHPRTQETGRAHLP